MNTSKHQNQFESLLNAPSRGELRSMVSRAGVKLSLPQLQTLVAHAESLEPPGQTLRLGIVHSYTSDLLNPWLDLAAALQGLHLQTYHAPYGLSPMEAQEDSGLTAHKPDLILFLLRREDLHPELGKPLATFSRVQQDELAAESVDRLRGILSRFREHNAGQIILTLLPSVLSPGLGVYDAQSERSETAWWARLKASIGQCLRESIQARESTTAISDQDGDALVRLALDGLDRIGLLVRGLPGIGESMTRREMLGVTAALLPVIASIVAPTPAMAQTGGFPSFNGTYTGSGTPDPAFNHCNIGPGPVSMLLALNAAGTGPLNITHTQANRTFPDTVSVVSSGSSFITVTGTNCDFTFTRPSIAGPYSATGHHDLSTDGRCESTFNITASKP